MRKFYKLKALMLFIMFFVISKSSLMGQINLTATAGTPTGSFATLSAAFAAINAGTHQGNIVISVDGNTTEPAAPVYLGANGISTALYTSVLIKPSVVATISGAPNAGSAVINFNGSDNVTIDGSITVGGTTRDLTISNTNAATVLNTACIRMIGQTVAGTGLGVTNFTIKNNNIIGSTPGNNGTSGSTNTTSYGIYAGSNTLTTMSATTAGANYDNVLIENNEIKKAYYGISIYGGIAPNQNDNLIVRNNTLGSTVVADQIGFKAIYVYQTTIGLIEGNTVSNIKATSSISNAAIEVGGTASTAVTVSRNRVEGIYSENTGGYGAYGINLVGGNNHIVVNNVVTDIKTINYNFPGSTFHAFGIRITTGTGHKIYYNSVNMFGTLPTGTNASFSSAFCVTSTAVTGIDVRNNIFSNKTTSQSSGAKEHLAVHFPSTYNFLNATLNNNFYGIPADGAHYVGKIGNTLGSGNYLDLAAWQAVSQINNLTNDVDSEPVSNAAVPFTTDLNLTIPAGVYHSSESGAVAIASLGLPNKDFLNIDRPGVGGTALAPDMGAYENATLAITCPQPTGLSLVEASTTDASFSWTAGGLEGSWQLQYGPVGFTPGTGTSVIAPTNPDTLTGLTPNTIYQLYVRGICGPGDTSFWTGPITFNTYDQGQFMEWDNACPSTNFIDISTTGTLIPLTDDQNVGINLPFTLLMQNTAYNTATLSNNGVIVLGTTTSTISWTNTTISGTSLTGLYPHWDDLDGVGPGVWIDTLGVAPNRQYVIQWSKDLLGAAGNPVTFELILDEATQEIYYVYEDVQTGLTTNSNGASATIGVAGVAQDLLVSFNNGTYLSNNSCAHFYYTDCPRPTNFAISYIYPDEAAFTWGAGLSGETNWTIIYGEAGFNLGTEGDTLTATATSMSIPGLQQLTCYDVYIFADCDVNLQSNYLFGTFCTTPFCANPTGMTNTTAVDSIFTAWNWTAFSPDYPSLDFNITYGPTGFDLYSEGTEFAAGNVLVDTIANPALLAGGVYQIYVQAVCTDILNGGTDTSSYIGPFSVTMPLSNDSICGAEMLAADGTVYTFNNTGATVQPSEATIAPPATGAQTTTGWINSTLNNTTWFTFVAPPSGSVRVNNTAINYAGQAAVYEVGSCSDFATFALLAANDNAIGGTSVAPNYTICGLTPGDTYYLLHDGSTATAGNYSISITPIVLQAGSFTDVINICTGDTANLFNGITGFDAGGIWTAELASAQTGVTDSLFASAGLAYQIFNFEYRLTDGCAYDSIIAQVEIYRPSSAGNDGTILVCKNEPYDLLSGLSGNVDVNGTWYDPSNNALPDSWLTAGNIPGQFNYDYITGNGVCPDDTANVLVTVNGACDWASIEEMYFGSMTLYPNPTNGLVYVSNEGSSEVFNYEIIDIDGRVISSANGAINGMNTTEINLNGKVTGMYMIRVFNENAEKVYRVILQ